MKKTTTLLLTIVLLLQMCTGFLVNSNESDRTDTKACEVEDVREYGGRASREEVRDNHTDACGPERSAASSASVPAEQDEFGGSWFDDFDDESGVEWEENTMVRDSMAKFDAIPIAMTEEFIICNDTQAQDYPRIAVDSTDNFIVTWQERSGTGYDWIYAKRFNIDGNPIGNNISVYTPSAHERNPAIAVDSNDNFTVCWDGGSIYAKQYSSQGQTIWNEKELHIGDHPAISTFSDNSFIICWDENTNIYAQRYDSSGNGVGNLIELCTATGFQEKPKIVINSKDEFIVTWQDTRNGDEDIYMKRFSQDGTPVGDEIIVCNATRMQKFPSIAINDNDNIVVTWQDRRVEPGDHSDIYAKYFDATCTPKGPDFPVFENYSDTQCSQVFFDHDGNFVICSMVNKGGNFAICLKFYSKNGSQIGDEVEDDDNDNSSNFPEIAVDSQNNFIVIWTDSRNGNSDIFGRKYAIGSNVSGSIVSTPITLPDNMIWDSLSIAKNEPANTYINVSIINNATNQTIIGFDNCTNRSLDLSDLNDMGITSIRLKAYFTGNGIATPSLDSWGVEWTAENTWRDSFVGDSEIAYPYGMDEHTVGYWRFDEGDGEKVKDFSGNGNNGTIIGAEWTSGRINYGLCFEQGNDRVEISDDNLLEFNKNDFSISLWFRSNNTQSGGLIGHWGSDVDHSVWMSIYDSELRFMGDEIGTSTAVDLIGGTINRNNWHHAAVTRFDENFSLFLDGIIVDRDNWNGSFKDIDSNWSIGRIAWDHSNINFHGSIDEVRISNIARTPDEIREAYQAGIAIHGGQVQLADNEIVAGQNTSALWHFNEGSGNVLHDSSGNGNDGVIHGANWTAGGMGGALEFDGENDYVQLLNSTYIADSFKSVFTVEMWFNTYSLYSVDNWRWLFLKAFTSHVSPYYQFGIQLDTNLNRLMARLSRDDGGGKYLIAWSMDNSISLNKWYHLVVTADIPNHNLSIYLNGIFQSSDNSPQGSYKNWDTDIGIGANLNNPISSSYNFKGIIDEVAIHDRALSPSEIYNHSNSYHLNSTLRSKNITLPENRSWSTFHCNRSVPDHTYLNITIHDAETNETLWMEYNRTSDPFVDLSGIDSTVHPSIYLQAYLQSNRTETPVLYDWAVNWTTTEDVITRPPELYEEIGNISFYEDTVSPNRLNLSEHFQDVSDPISPLVYFIINTGGQHINASINGTMVSFWSDKANWSGTETFKVNCTNGLNLTTESNVFNVTVIPVDDRPMWKQGISNIVLVEDNSSEIINLTELVEDAEGDPFNLSYLVNEMNLTVNISQGNMVITPLDNWFGNATVEMTVYQVSNDTLNSTITFDVEVTSENDLPIAHLLYPENGSTFNTREVTLSWLGYDVESSIGALRYDIYISNDLTRGITSNDATHTNIEGTELTVTLDYGTYYWSVIGFDGEDYGICTDGYYTFNITNITIPEVELLSPAPNSTVNTTNVTLRWKAIDTVGISFILYFGNSSDALVKIAELEDTSYLMSDLEENSTYYWKVCAKLNNITGECVSGVWRFTINTSFEYIYEISVDVDTTLLKVKQGMDGEFTLSITNLGNSEMTILFSAQGELKNLLVFPHNISLAIGGQKDIVITLTGTSTLVPNTYNAEIVLSYPGKTKMITVPVKIVGKSEPDTDGDEDEGMSSLTKGLIIGGVILILIVIIMLFLVFRKRKKEDEDEEEEAEEPESSPPATEAVDGQISEGNETQWEPVQEDATTQEIVQEPPAEQPISWEPVPQEPSEEPLYEEEVEETESTPEEPLEPLEPIPPIEELYEEPEEEFESPPMEEEEAPVDDLPPLDDIFGVTTTPPDEPIVTEPPQDEYIEPEESVPPPVTEPVITTYKDIIAETPPEPISSNVMRLIPNYNITHKLGAGGFGTVYKAMHISGRYVAIKLPKMLGETVDMNVLLKFQEEAEIWHKLSHPNIVEFIEGEIRPVPYLAIELMEGGNLKQLVSKYQLNIGEAVFIMAQILDGMSFAHRMATVHRDLKPENILFAKDGTPKISDWGIGKFMGSMSADKTMGMKGTMLYSAPEQISKAKFGQVDWATDIFQLGIVFYEMITREHPFYDEDPVGIIAKITGEDPIPPSEINPLIPKELDNIIMTALQKDKAKRWRSADIMHHELKKLVEG